MTQTPETSLDTVSRDAAYQKAAVVKDSSSQASTAQRSDERTVVTTLTVGEVRLLYTPREQLCSTAKTTTP